jgi:hypothetical protein
MYRTEIVNADKPLVIEVPKQLPKKGRRKNSYHCAFAEACALKPDVEEAIIHLSTAYIRFKGHKRFRRYRVQQRLRDQIVMFDKYGDFEPGEYTLGIIQPSHQASGSRQGSNTKPVFHEREPKDPAKRKRVLVKGVRAPAKISSL